MLNIKRFRKFTRQLDEYKANPFFNKVRELYASDSIKRIDTAENLLKKIKYTKKNTLFKSSIKSVDKINDLYEVILVEKNKQLLEKNKIKDRKLKLTKKIIDDNNLGVRTHQYEFIKLQRNIKDSYYIQKVEFFNKDGILSDSELYETKYFNTILNLNTKEGKKYYKDTIKFQMETEYQWLIKLWCDKENQLDNYAVITTTAYKKIEPVLNINIEQTFRDNDNGTCVYDGFLKFFTSNDKNKKTVYNKLVKEQSKYAKSYKLDELKEICEFTSSNLTIKNLVNGEDKQILIKNARYNLTFYNTKFNHLDLLTHSYNEKIEVDNINELEKIKNNSDFYIEKFNEVITLDNIYKVKDSDFKIEYKKWKDDIKYNTLVIDNDNDEMKLINNYDYSTHTFFNKFEVNDELYDELDIEKAYFNYSNKEKNKNYHGVPSGAFINLKCEESYNIKTFETQLKNKLIGYYQVNVLKINKHHQVFEKIGILENNIYVFTSVQINEFKKYIDFQFINLSISPSVNIPFPKSFLNKDNKISYYCKAFGIMMSSSEHISITIKPLVCDVKYFNLIQNEDLTIYEMDGLIKINNKNEKIKNCCHIAFYIHSYIKTLIFEQLLEVDINDVFGIKIDSIVIKKGSIIKTINEPFYKEFKPCKIERMLKNVNYCEGVGWVKDDFGDLVYREADYTGNGYYRPLFIQSIDKVDFMRSFLPNYEMIVSPIVFMSGKGGSGKSHAVLSNLKNVCMVSMCWNLSQAKKEEYETLTPLSINKLVGDKCEKADIFNKILFLDELTMWNKKHVLQSINDNKDKFIFMAGDIDYNGRFYQCNIQNEVINPSEIKNCQFVVYTKNYRFDDELNNLLDGLRIAENQREYIDIYFKNNFKNKEDVVFGDNCIGISDLNDVKKDNELTNYFIGKGAKPQYYIKDTRYNLGQYKGAKLDNIPDHKNYECKLFKTIHSFQGLDLKHNEKIIISNKLNFDKNLYYTAFSRARRLDQIIIIN